MKFGDVWQWDVEPGTVVTGMYVSTDASDVSIVIADSDPDPRSLWEFGSIRRGMLDMAGVTVIEEAP